MMLSLVFLLAWGSVFLGHSHTLSLASKPDLGLESLKQLVLIRKTLDKQAHRLRNLEINLHHVLSKVVFLSDADVHGTRWSSSQGDPFGELAEHYQKVLLRLDQEESTKGVLQKLEQHLVELKAQSKNFCCDKGNSKPLENKTDEVSSQFVPEIEQPPEVDFVQPDKSDCHELDKRQRVDGVYRFLIPELNELGRDFNERQCSFATAGPAWTVIQRRGISDPPENFNRSWDEYRAGFGNLSRDFWFGNQFTHKILYRDDHELRVELEAENEEELPDWAEYAVFRLDSEGYNYQLSVDGGFRGSLPDALELHNQLDFSTHDHRSINPSGNGSCAESYGGGWWFGICTESNLNGNRRKIEQGADRPAIIWPNWDSVIGKSAPKASRMMIRRVSTDPDNTPHNKDD